MAIPEEVELFKEGKEVKTEPLVPCNVGIDDVKESSFEKVRKVFVKQAKGSLQDRVHHRSFLEKGSELSLDFADGAIAVSKAEKF
jgi:hypothetical protein